MVAAVFKLGIVNSEVGVPFFFFPTSPVRDDMLVEME